MHLAMSASAQRLKGTDVGRADHDIGEPDGIFRMGMSDPVLPGGVRSYIIEQSEEIDLQVAAGAPAEALKRCTILLHQGKALPGPGTAPHTSGDVHDQLTIQPEGQFAIVPVRS